MKARRRLVVYAAMALVIVGSRPLFGQEVSLRYLWKKGETLRYRSTQQTAVNMSGLPGIGDMTVNTTISQVMKMVAEDVAADGTATVRVTFESVKMDMSGPMGNIVYDSAAPPTQPADPMTDAIAKGMSVLVGESFSLVTTPNGAVTKLEGMSRLAEKFQKTVPQAAGMGLGGLESMFSDESMKSTFEQSFATLPDRRVKPGDGWTHQAKIANPMGPMTTSTAYTLKAVESPGGAQLARVALTMVLKPAGPATPNAAMPMTVTLGEGSGEGEIWFDVRVGRLQKSVLRQTQPMTMSMADGSALAIQALTKATTTVELVEK